MTDKEKEIVESLRKFGVGYRSIATALGLCRDIVRNYCKAKGLDGYGNTIYKGQTEEGIFQEDKRSKCKNCGKPIEQPKIGRKRLYCSTFCKKEWDKKII